MSGGKGLYTPEILASAMELTAFPWIETHHFKGAARSRSCGSAIEIGLSLDLHGHVAAVGVKPHACAVGQAAAAIFAKGAIGLGRNDLLGARETLAKWLAGGDAEPAWPGIALLEPARAYAARHGAILLAWDAGLDALDD